MLTDFPLGRFRSSSPVLTETMSQLSTMTTSLLYQHHTDTILQALETRTELEIEISGSDNVRTDSSSLWLLSPLVRSVLASLREVQGNTLILPDFSSEDVRTALDIIGGVQKGLLVFNSSTKSLLETFGVNISGIRISTAERDIKTERSYENRESTDGENEDEFPKLFLAHNTGIDDSYDEDIEQNDECSVFPGPLITTCFRGLVCIWYLKPISDNNSSEGSLWSSPAVLLRGILEFLLCQ